MRAFFGWLVLAASALAAAPVQRELFTLELPRGWRETPDRYAGLDLVGEEATAPRVPASRFIAGTRDCGCIVSAVAINDGTTPESYAAMVRGYVTRNAAVLRSTPLKEFAGRRGAGFRVVVQQPYPVATAVLIFTFVERGVACTVQGQASDPDAAIAEKILARHLAEVQAIAASLRLKSPAATKP